MNITAQEHRTAVRKARAILAAVIVAGIVTIGPAIMTGKPLIGAACFAALVCCVGMFCAAVLK